jgi:hypothetical protein
MFSRKITWSLGRCSSSGRPRMLLARIFSAAPPDQVEEDIMKRLILAAATALLALGAFGAPPIYLLSISAWTVS